MSKAAEASPGLNGELTLIGERFARTIIARNQCNRGSGMREQTIRVGGILHLTSENTSEMTFEAGTCKSSLPLARDLGMLLLLSTRLVLCTHSRPMACLLCM
jgi:hypothetical protein